MRATLVLYGSLRLQSCFLLKVLEGTYHMCFMSSRTVPMTFLMHSADQGCQQGKLYEEEGSTPV